MDTATYILTCNTPHQLEFLLRSFCINNPQLITETQLIIVDQSTISQASSENKFVLNKFSNNYQYYLLENLGCSGGRHQVARLFNESNYEYMLYFEDDMTLSYNRRDRCRFGFSFYIENMIETSKNILIHENLDYLKLSFHEVYNDHSSLWPISRFTHFNKLGSYNNIGYFIGDIYFSNWPIIITKNGNTKIFDLNNIKTEYDLALHSLNLIENNILKTGVLCASPIYHCRIQEIINHRR